MKKIQKKKPPVQGISEEDEHTTTKKIPGTIIQRSDSRVSASSTGSTPKTPKRGSQANKTPTSSTSPKRKLGEIKLVSNQPKMEGISLNGNVDFVTATHEIPLFFRKESSLEGVDIEVKTPQNRRDPSFGFKISPSNEFSNEFKVSVLPKISNKPSNSHLFEQWIHAGTPLHSLSVSLGFTRHQVKTIKEVPLPVSQPQKTLKCP